MGDLLTLDDHEEVFAAFNDLHDTFHKDTVSYLAYTDNHSRMDNKNTATATPKDLLCRITKSTAESDKNKVTIDGSERVFDVSLRFMARYLKTQSLMTGNIPTFNDTKDYFVVDGNRCRLDYISFDDTDFAGEIAVVVCYCMIDNKKA